MSISIPSSFIPLLATLFSLLSALYHLSTSPHIFLPDSFLLRSEERIPLGLMSMIHNILFSTIFSLLSSPPFVSHSFFFAERNLSPKGIPHRPPHLSTSPSVLLPYSFFFRYAERIPRSTWDRQLDKSISFRYYYFPVPPHLFYRVLRKYLNQNHVIFECFGK